MAVLRYEPDAGLSAMTNRRVGDVGAFQHDAPGGRVGGADDRVDQFGLTVALDPGDTEYFATMHPQRHVVHRGPAIFVDDGQGLDLEHDLVGDGGVGGRR